MAEFTGRYTGSHRVASSVQHARDIFANPLKVAEHFGDLESYELIDERTIRFQLPEHHYGVTKFRGHYTCHYETPDDHTAAWESTRNDEPIYNKGRASFRADGDGCVLDFDGSITIRLNVNRLLAKGLKPVIEAWVARDLKGFVERMVKDASG